MVAPPSRRPVVASVLSLVGSLFFLLIGFGYFFVGALLGLASAIVVIVSAAMLYARPSQHVAWGVIILIFSITSLFGFGGFVAGMALGITGGAIGMAWGTQPSGYGGAYAMPLAGMYMGPYGVPVMPWRMCVGCGRWIPWAYNVCPLCGTKAEPAPAGAPAPMPAPPTPAMPAAPETIRAPCPTCRGEAEWLPAYKKWYCATETRYF
jgi:hypothetical protein